MRNDPRLERYLTSLENALRPFPVGDRADIITEIRSHVLSAIERDSQTSIDSVLTALGEPETVANRYLLERGLKPTKTSISPIVKWLVIGFLSMFAMVLIFVGYLFNHFNSLVRVDGPNERVQLFGGLIDIDGKQNRLSMTGFSDSSRFAGSASLSPKQSVVASFATGAVEVAVADGNELIWVCKGHGSAPELSTADEKVTLDLSKVGNAKCTLSLPKGHALSINGALGKIDIKKPLFDVDAELTTGKIGFEGDPGAEYRFTSSVVTGHAGAFVSSTKPDAYSIQLRVTTGAINQ